LHVSAEKLQHALEAVGFTRWLGNKGRGLKLTPEAQLLVYDLTCLPQGEVVFSWLTRRRLSHLHWTFTAVTNWQDVSCEGCAGCEGFFDIDSLLQNSCG